MARAIWFALLLVVAIGGALVSRSTLAADVVRVETADGRTLSGVVDARSDDATLWLRQEEAGVFLSVPAAWGAVSAATLNGEAIEIAELQKRREALSTAGPRLLIEEAVVPAVGSAGVLPYSVVSPAGWTAGSARVRNLEVVGAELVNLDRDVEPDGLSVSVVAVGEDGLPVAVRGSLRAELHGERRSAGDPAPRFETLDRWTQRVRSEDFVDGVASYCLRFRQTQPEWEFDLTPDAVISVQLGASGHGNYYASAPVVLRRFNPLRDNLQQYDGTRFLPGEVSGWRDQAPFGVRNGMWQWWGR